MSRVVVVLVLVLVVAAVVAAFARHARRRDPPVADRGVPDDDPWPTGATPAVPPRPGWAAWSVPPRPTGGVRDRLWAPLRAAVRPGRPVVLHPADGAPGRGVTTVLTEFAYRARAEHDVTWWVPAADPPLVVDRLAELAETLGLAGPGDTARVATDRLRAALRDRDRWLLVLDDAASPRQLADLLPDGPGHVLVASSDPAWAAHARVVTVPPLTAAAAADLLHERCPGVVGARELAAALGHVPLAVHVAGATLAAADLDVAAYRGLLADRPGDDPATAACAVALDRLAADHPAAAALLGVLAFLAPDPVPLALLTGHPEVLPVPLRGLVTAPDRLGHALDVLVARGLLQVDARAAPTVTVHPVPAALLVPRDRGDGAATAVRLLRAAAPADRATWRRLLPHVLAVTDPARRLDDVAGEVVWLLRGAGRHLRERGEERTARALVEDALDLARRRFGPDHPATRALVAERARTART